MKQTAMQELWDWIDANCNEDNFNIFDAKKMSLENEKEQIMNAWATGVISQGNMTAEQYYIETFKK